MTDAEKREAARQFYQKWAGRGKEDEDDRSYWIDIFTRIFGIDNATDYIVFQKKVIVDGNTKRIDAYIPETKVLIEQKSLGVPLDKKIRQSGEIELTPYEQAKRYNDNLPYGEKARWIVICNFEEIWIYDMDTRVPEPVKMEIRDLQSQYSMLDFLINQNTEKVSLEMKVSLQAGELVGKMYDAFLQQYKDPDSPETLKSLNKLCVRIVFCLYAEDAGIFGEKGMFHNYLSQFDAKTARKGLKELFEILDQKPEDRDEYIYDDDPILAAFPYVNGGLFADENIEIPPFTDEILSMILKNASDNFDWSMISPTIFGALFEATLNPETRRSGGMHYTSIENIHKVIDPLFLDELKDELLSIKNEAVQKTRDKKLKAFQKKLASLCWLDPAAGSGNFLTETYISIRRLENEVIKELQRGQIVMGYEGMPSPIQVSINQFYGIEINDFAVTVAKTALWIAESQMMKETEDIVLMDLDFLPLTTNANIIEDNALHIDWEKVVPKSKLSYIMGNPPFVGTKLMNKSQKNDTKLVLGEYKSFGTLDYVACWYKKANDYIKGTNIKCAFVSTNSICQGEQVSILWKPLFSDGVIINYAYRTFRWDSEASSKAQVHCIIIGFSHMDDKKKYIIDESGKKIIVNHINAYLVNAADVFVESRRNPICNVQHMFLGCDFKDDNNYIFTEEEKNEFLKKEPLAEKYIKKYINAKELINRKPRYCLWLVNANPKDIHNMPLVLERIQKVKEFRENSNSDDTKRYAEFPMRPARLRYYSEPRTTKALGLPRISSQTRRYLPMEMFDENTIGGASILMIPEATLYTFAILSSNVHMAWMRAVCGRMKSDYRYANGIVYNTFPWPKASIEQMKKIEKTAQEILNARALFPDSTLADLYDPLTMPSELRKAHRKNDTEVMKAYGFSIKNTSEADCVANLMEMYQELSSK